jgi:hypothetical protein
MDTTDPTDKAEAAEERALSPEDAAAHEQYLIDLAIELRRQHFGL